MKYELELSSLGCRENIFCIVGIKDRAVKRENLQATSTHITYTMQNT